MKAFRKVILIAVVLLCSGVALAQTSGNYDLTWWTVDGGGASVSGGGYTLNGSAGQPEAGATLSGGGFTLVSGFWAGASDDQHYEVYLPLVVRIY